MSSRERQIGLRLRRCGAGLPSAQHYRFTHKLVFSQQEEQRRGRIVYIWVHVIKEDYAAPPVMASLMPTEILKSFRSKQILFLSLPAFLPSTSGLKQGPAFAVKVSDLLKLDILVTKASPHFPRLRGGSLSLPGTQSLCLSGPSATSSIIHTETDVHNADLFIWLGWAKIGSFLEH